MALLVKQAIGGEACEALVPGYDIAAKTGTSLIPGLGSYEPNTTVASTAAFGPVGIDLRQQFVMLVKVDKPAGMYGSEVTSPVVRDIYSHLFQHFGVLPSQHPVQPTQGVCHAPLSAAGLDPWPPKP